MESWIAVAIAFEGCCHGRRDRDCRRADRIELLISLPGARSWFNRRRLSVLMLSQTPRIDSKESSKSVEARRIRPSDCAGREKSFCSLSSGLRGLIEVKLRFVRTSRVVACKILPI